MLLLITGGSKNGKSGFAESLFQNRTNPRYYLATMEPFGEDAWEAIRRHQAMRAERGFTTIEKYRDIKEIEIPKGSDLLIECMATLTANEMFAGEEIMNPTEKIAEAVADLRGRTDLLVVVTNDVGSDGVEYEEGTMAYIRALGQLNKRLAAMSDCTVECICGIPVALKGTWEIDAAEKKEYGREAGGNL